MAETLEIKLTVNLPVLGNRTFVLDEPVSGLEENVANELLSLDGGSLTATATVTKK